ncbi:MAG: GDP-mannose 4,6-dehydratase [bacterium]
MAEKIKVAVIGSNSFSGSDFIDLLLEKKRYSVIGISRSIEKSSLFLPYLKRPLDDFKFHRMDLNRDMEGIIALLDSWKPRYIINFAAQSEVAPSWDYPEQWFFTNAAAVAQLCNFLKGCKWLKRYVHISSPEVYGTCLGTIKEDAALNPSTPYAASKAAGDLFLFTLVKNFWFPSCNDSFYKCIRGASTAFQDYTQINYLY